MVKMIEKKRKGLGELRNKISINQDNSVIVFNDNVEKRNTEILPTTASGTVRDRS